MTAFDDLILEQSVRRRVGQPGRMTYVGPSDQSPLAAFRGIAERISGTSIDLVVITDGIPGHFSLHSRNRQTVVFHQRQVEVCAFLYGLTLEERFEQSLAELVFEGTVLRLIAEFLLQGGHGDQALATLARSRRVQAGIVMYGPTIDDLERLERDERYLVEWFYALGHEIGHGLGPGPARGIRDLDCLSSATVEELVETILDVRFADENYEILKSVIARGDTDEGPRSHASTQVVREEAVADIFSVICLSEAWNALCEDDAGRGYSAEHLLFAAILSMSSVMIIEQCRIMANWFSSMSNEVEDQSLMLSGVALQARINLLHFALSNRSALTFLTSLCPSIQGFVRLDESALDRGLRYLESRSLQMQLPFGRARKFLSSPEMRDASLLQNYFEEVAADESTRFDALNFLRVSRHANSPMLDALREVVGGGEPPIITFTR